VQVSKKERTTNATVNDYDTKYYCYYFFSLYVADSETDAAVLLTTTRHLTTINKCELEIRMRDCIM